MIARSSTLARWEAMMRIQALVTATALAVVLCGTAIAGVDAELSFKKVIGIEAGRVNLEGLSVPLVSDADVLLVRIADPTAIKDGEFVSSAKQPGEGAPLWLLLGGEARQLQRLIEAAEIKTSEPKKVGGIGTCGLYTPCPKCRRGFEETVARRQLRPTTLRVEPLRGSELKVGQLLAASDAQALRKPLLVFADERASRALNEIRALAARSNRLIP